MNEIGFSLKLKTIMNSWEDRIKKLEARKEQLNAEINKHKALNSVEKRKRDTRKKILLGAWVLNKIDSGDWSKQEIWAEMDNYLTNKYDRAIFDLPPLEPDF